MAAAPDIPAVEAYVSNIDFSASAKDLAEYFSSYGRVVRCKLPSNKKQPTSGSHRHRGFGFVTFASVQDLEVVLQAHHDHSFRGRQLKVKKSDQAQGVVLKDENGIFLFQNGRLDVGVYLEEQGLFLRKWTVPSFKVLTVVNFQRRYVKFSYLASSGQHKLHIKHNLDDVYDLVDVQCHNSTSGRDNAIIFRSQSAPKLNSEETDMFAMLLQDGLFWESVSTDDEGDTVKRVTDFSTDNSLSNCFDYMLVSKDVARNGSKFRTVAESSGYTVTRTTEITPIKPLVSQPKCDAAKALSFRVLFQIDVLVTEGIVYHDLLPPSFFQLLRDVESEDSAITALQQLSQKSMYPIEDPVAALTEAIKPVIATRQGVEHTKVKAKKPPLDPSTAVPIHRVFVTPLRTICWGPEVDTPNRVIREFSHCIDRFLRVSFTDEDWNRLQISRADEPMEELYGRVRHILREGLVVGGRYFEFLATSSSQLREHSCWFFAPTDDLKAADIRDWMGDFSHIRNVGKYAARMGQCFSSTVTSKECEVREEEFQDISDIKTVDDQYTFTDGIGSISPEFARSVSKTVGYLKGRIPSAFQIRFSGYKGVVAVDERMRGGRTKLRLRPSMKKFQCHHYYLEVCKTTSLMPCFLNRQIVTLLSTLGVADGVFLSKQQLMVENLEMMLEDRQAAVNFLKQSCNPSPRSVLGGVIEMLNAEFDMNEPFLQGVLRAHRLAQLQDLRNRARIFLKEGACLMGVIDETRTLRYGQVFVRVTDPANRWGTAKIIEGPVAVAKNPCFHPGDVRTLQAVDVPKLRHLVDCLVFPAQGPRPHTDECSGSDLDGDLYFITWDQDLIPPRQNLVPMDYQGITPTPLEHPRPIETPDLHEFFVNYMKNDQLGPIANAHLVWSDYSPSKAEDPKCLRLAELHSVAVDYPKTGVPAEMKRDLRPQFYPNFMNKSDRVQYTSRSVLGRLFAQIDKDVQHEMRATDVNYDAWRDFDDSLVIKGYEEYAHEAQNLRDQYNHDLRGIMAKYDIKKESEAVTGAILRVSRKLRRNRLADIRLQIRREVNELVKSYRVAFEQEFSRDDGIPSTRLRVASAWYCATYSPYLRPELDRSSGRRRGQKPLLSFPWILYDCLCEIKKSHLPRSKPRRV